MSLTYGIDIHGTLAASNSEGTQGPSTLFPLLEPLMRALRNKGDRVFIVSGPPAETIVKEVKALGLKAGIHYDALVSVVDFLRDRDVKMWEEEPGHWWCHKAEWDAAKGRICTEYNIDIIIDDQASYAPGMPNTTKFVLVTAEVLGGRPSVAQWEDEPQQDVAVEVDTPDGVRSVLEACREAGPDSGHTTYYKGHLLLHAANYIEWLEKLAAMRTS